MLVPVTSRGDSCITVYHHVFFINQRGFVCLTAQQFYLSSADTDLVSDLSCRPAVSYKTHSYAVMQFGLQCFCDAQTPISQSREHYIFPIPSCSYLLFHQQLLTVFLAEKELLYCSISKVRDFYISSRQQILLNKKTKKIQSISAWVSIWFSLHLFILHPILHSSYQSQQKIYMYVKFSIQVLKCAA